MTSQHKADLDTNRSDLPVSTRKTEQKRSTTKHHFFIRRSGKARLGIAFILSIVATLMLGTFAMAATQFNPAQNAVIYSCYNVKNGSDLRLIDPTNPNGCKNGEQQLTWNQRGPQGLKGDAGDKGDTGPQGIQGLKGDTGP